MTRKKRKKVYRLTESKQVGESQVVTHEESILAAVVLLKLLESLCDKNKNQRQAATSQERVEVEEKMRGVKGKRETFKNVCALPSSTLTMASLSLQNFG
jgi:hypothetical protein